MSRKRSGKKSAEAKRPVVRPEPAVAPGSLTQASQVAVLRIIAAGLLFAVLAFWGLAKMRHFSEGFILRHEIQSFRSAVNRAQVSAVQKRQTVRLLLSEFEKSHICRFEKLARNPQICVGIPMNNEDDAYGKNPENWSPAEPSQYRLLSLIDVSVGSLTTVYMFPDGSFANGWPLPSFLFYNPEMKTEPVRFSLDDAVETVVFSASGLMD